MTHADEKAVASAHTGRLRDQLRDSEDQLGQLVTAMEHLDHMRKCIIRRRVGWLQELDALKTQIEQPE